MKERKALKDEQDFISKHCRQLSSGILRLGKNISGRTKVKCPGHIMTVINYVNWSYATVYV